MSRPLHIKFSGAIYLVTSRGDLRELIYRDDEDWVEHLTVIAHAMDRFDAKVLAYCLLSKHFQMVQDTRQANLSRLMRQINGVYTQRFKRRHSLGWTPVSRPLQGHPGGPRAYLLAVCHYVGRKPVAAGIGLKGRPDPLSRGGNGEGGCSGRKAARLGNATSGTRLTSAPLPYGGKHGLP